MAQVAKSEKSFVETIEEKLVSKVGGIPVWAVVIVPLVVGVVYLYNHYGKKYR